MEDDMRCQLRNSTMLLKRTILWILLLALALPSFAEKLPTARPEMVGLSSSRLERLTEVMQTYVDQGKLGGAGTLGPRVEVHPGIQEHDWGRPGRGEKGAGLQGRAGEAAHRHSRSADPLGRHLLRRRTGQGPLQGGRHPRLVPGGPGRACGRYRQEAGHACLRRARA